MRDLSSGMANLLAVLAVTALGTMLCAPLVAASPDLGWAQSFGVPGYQTVTNGHGDSNSPTQVRGDLAVASGAHHFDSSAQLTSAVTSDDGLNRDADFVLQVGTQLTTSNRASMNGIDDGTAMPVPEPATILLLASGLIGLGAARKRFKKA